MDTEPRPIGAPIYTDISKPVDERRLATVLEVDAGQVGASKWEEMLRLTQSDGKEREISVSLFRGKLEITGITEGNETSATSPVDFAGVLLGKRKIARIHTHPGEKDQPSDTDIQVAHGNPERVEIMLDKGGAHLLISKRSPHPGETVPRVKEKRHLEVLGTTGLLKDAIRLVAGDLESYGLAYYFCPDLSSGSETKIFYLATRYPFPSFS